MAESEIPVRNVLQIREMQKAKDYYAKLATQLCICLLHSAHGPILYFNFDYIDYFPQLHKHRREKKKKKKKKAKVLKLMQLGKSKEILLTLEYIPSLPPAWLPGSPAFTHLSASSLQELSYRQSATLGA